MPLTTERPFMVAKLACLNILPRGCFIALDDIEVHDNVLAEWADFVSNPPVISYSALLDQGLPKHILDRTNGFSPNKYQPTGTPNSSLSMAQKLSFWKPRI